ARISLSFPLARSSRSAATSAAASLRHASSPSTWNTLPARPCRRAARSAALAFAKASSHSLPASVIACPSAAHPVDAGRRALLHAPGRAVLDQHGRADARAAALDDADVERAPPGRRPHDRRAVLVLER